MYRNCLKRIFDFCCSLFAFIVLSPFLLGFMVLGAIFMKGNPFFTQPRSGKDEKIFRLIKFRTMSNAKDKNGNLLPDEQRINSYGQFLRSTSVDGKYIIRSNQKNSVKSRVLQVSPLHFFDGCSQKFFDIFFNNMLGTVA